MTRSEWLAWALLFVALQLGDVATTILGLAAGAEELNPFGARLFAEHGVWTIWPLKAAMLAVVLALAHRLWTRFPEGARVLWVFAGAYLVVVANNATWVV